MSLKKMLVLSAIVAGLASVSSYQAMAKEHEAATTQPAEGKYVCKHCKTSANEPGKCPKCGMEMKKAKATASTTQPAKKHSENVGQKHESKEGQSEKH